MTSSQIGQISLPQSAPKVSGGSGQSERFQDALNAQMSKDPVKLSAHAQKRLDESNLQLSDQDKVRLGQAVSQMGEKGAQRSLVLMDSLALVVSVKNRTVITAVDGARANTGAFTNIDSAIIV